MRQATSRPSRRVSSSRTLAAARHSSSGVAAAPRVWRVVTVASGSHASSITVWCPGVRLIQHKREAYWFYRFLSLWYDRWVNPLFWTPAMRALALEDARLEPGLSVVDVGA